MRLRERGQVANGPRHHIPVAVEIPFAARRRTEDFRDVPRHRRFFGQDRNCTRAQTTSLVFPVDYYVPPTGCGWGPLRLRRLIRLRAERIQERIAEGGSADASVGVGPRYGVADAVVDWHTLFHFIYGFRRFSQYLFCIAWDMDSVPAALPYSAQDGAHMTQE